MKYKKIIFIKNNVQLAGIRIQENGLKRSLTLEEAIKESAKLRKENKDDAIEFLNTKSKVETAKVSLFNEKPVKKRKWSLKGIIATATAFVVAAGIGGYALKESET